MEYDTGDERLNEIFERLDRLERGHTEGMTLMTEVCGRCLVVMNASAYVRARDNSGQIVGDYPNFMDMKSLKQWAIGMIQRGYDIEMNANRYCFEPISTWYGDPICQVHLWEARDREMRETGMVRKRYGK